MAAVCGANVPAGRTGKSIQVMCLGGEEIELFHYGEMQTLLDAASNTGEVILPVCIKHGVMEKVAEYADNNADKPPFVSPGAPKTCDLPHCDQKMFDGLYEQKGMEFICDFINAADFLVYDRLKHSLYPWIVKKFMKGKTPEQMRQIFGIKNDLAGTEAAGTEAAAEAAN